MDELSCCWCGFTSDREDLFEPHDVDAGVWQCRDQDDCEDRIVSNEADARNDAEAF